MNKIFQTPIFVDLDGTLIKSDLFVETTLQALITRPGILLKLPSWLFAGRNVAKTFAAYYGRIDVTTLPYNLELIEYLRDQRSKGRPIYLATASHISLARRVARELQLFDGVYATNAKCNLKGVTKLAAIKNAVKTDFAYAGDSRADRPIWREAKTAIMVNPPHTDKAALLRQNKVEKIFETGQGLIPSLLKAIRPHQFVKNILVFLPLLTSHKYVETESITATCLAFIAFCACAAGVYITNDIVDITADRSHPRKRFRPIAAGNLSPVTGIIAAVLFFLISGLLALNFLPGYFMIALASYFILTILYSFWLKRVSTVDVITLAGLYTVRVIAGAEAINILPSFWILLFSIFLFLSLAFLKRYIELLETKSKEPERINGRGYGAVDMETMFVLGSGAGLLSVLVMALYINSPEVSILYKTPQLLWLICPILLYWVSRIWVGARRGKIDSDPIVFAVKDRISALVGALCFFIILASHNF